MGVYELSSSKGCLAETFKRKKKKKGTPFICFHLPTAAPAARGPPRAARLCARTCVQVGAPGRAAVNAESRALAHTVLPNDRRPLNEGARVLAAWKRVSGHWNPSSHPRRAHRRPRTATLRLNPARRSQLGTRTPAGTWARGRAHGSPKGAAGRGSRGAGKNRSDGSTGCGEEAKNADSWAVAQEKLQEAGRRRGVRGEDGPCAAAERNQEEHVSGPHSSSPPTSGAGPWC